MMENTKNMDKPKQIIVVMGPAGCGKSTFAAFLAKRLEVPMIEGDDVSTPSVNY